MARLGRSRHRAPRVGGARVEVEVVFRLGDGGGRGGSGVHERFGDLGEGDVFVDGDQVLDAGDQVLEIRAEGAVAEAVRQAVADGAEAAEELVARRLRGGLGRRRCHHRHTCDFADAAAGLANASRVRVVDICVPFYVGQSGYVGPCFDQCFLKAFHFGSGDILLGAQKPDNEETKFI